MLQLFAVRTVTRLVKQHVPLLVSKLELPVDIAEELMRGLEVRCELPTTFMDFAWVRMDQKEEHVEGGYPTTLSLKVNAFSPLCDLEDGKPFQVFTFKELSEKDYSKLVVYFLALDLRNLWQAYHGYTMFDHLLDPAVGQVLDARSFAQEYTLPLKW